MAQVDRRAMIRMGALGGVALLAGCATAPRYSVADGVHHLLTLSTQRAFARLFAPNGFYDAQVARIDRLAPPGGPSGKLGAMIGAVMQTDAFRRRLSWTLNGIAQNAAERATPLVLDAIRGMGEREALVAIRGGPTAATDLLKLRAGPVVADTLLPGISRGLRADMAEMAGAALAAATGIDYVELGQTLAAQAMDAMFVAIGREEAAIRRDPAATRDPAIVALLGGRR